jgi:hypothetical protein
MNCIYFAIEAKQFRHQPSPPLQLIRIFHHHKKAALAILKHLRTKEEIIWTKVKPNWTDGGKFFEKRLNNIKFNLIKIKEERRRAEIERKEREEAERKERERQELERRREAEMELERQKELERERERAAEEEKMKAHREEARRRLEMERIKELEKIRIRDLEVNY